MDLTIERVAYRLREPIRASWGTVRDREMALVRVRDGEHVGVGEAAPLPGFGHLAADLDATVELLRGVAGEASVEAAIAAMPSQGSARFARAALDMAGWDLRGKAQGRPVAALLAGDPLPAVPVNALLSAEDRAGAATQAAEAVAAGFRCVKVKVGIGDDAGRVAAVRAAVGPDVAIRIDANGAWTPAEAAQHLRALAPVGIELCEEPTPGHASMRELRASDATVPIALDESAAGSFGGVDAACLRIGEQGGIGPLLAAAGRARAEDTDVYLASTFDGPVGVAAALHAAAALRVTRPCGLATLGFFEDLEDPFPPRDGHIAMPQGPGLGI